MAELKDDQKDTSGGKSSEKTLAETVLKLEEIDTDLYRSVYLWRPLMARGVFGGQVVGQALVAASNTKPPDVHVHSLHCYFLKSGNPDRPILYHVERVRDGASFAARIVRAVQEGKTIFTMIVSFHKHEELPVEYQYKMPDVPPPEKLVNYEDLLRIYLKNDDIPTVQREYIQKVLATEIQIGVKPVDPLRHRNLGSRKAEALEPKLLVWLKANGNLGSTDQNLHRCLAAYISDYALLRTAILPHPNLRVKMMASLDHTMWFHTHFQSDDWMLYEIESPRLINGRALSTGRLWKRDGTLAATVAQEGVIRGVLAQQKESKL